MAASSLQPTDASCISRPTEALVVAILGTRAKPGSIAHLQFDTVPQGDLGKSVEDFGNRMRNMAQSDAIAISMAARGQFWQWGALPTSACRWAFVWFL
jgi:hypothetical protein